MDFIPIPIALNEIPEDLIASVAEKINKRTVALVRCRQYKSGYQEAMHIGSGTLANIEGVYGVLTAYHVVEKLEGGPCHIGLDIGNSPHAFLIDKDFTEILNVAKPESDSLGPDLAFIKLPRADVETIKASTMSFHSVSKDIADLKSNPQLKGTGAWFLCGVPAEGTLEQGPWSHYKKVYAFQHFTLPVLIGPPYQRNGFDFVQMEINYLDYERAPRSIDGMSGGGLWQASIEKTQSGEIRSLGIYLSGVIFYQSALVDEQRKITCHFRDSIHNQVIEAIQANGARTP